MAKTKKEQTSPRRSKRIRPSTQPARINNHRSMSTTSTPTTTTTTLIYTAPETLTLGIPTDALIPYQESTSTTESSKEEEECIICRESLCSETSITLSTCGHSFRKSCMDQCLAMMKPQCPICRTALGAPHGTSPSGTLQIRFESSFDCAGYEGAGTIVLRYRMEGGIQKAFQEHPGIRHAGKSATAYLPNTIDGQKLCKRLKYSFRQGLSFTVGTSATTGMPNQCTWSSVHHKTNTCGGSAVHGYPDQGYFINCNEELDGLGVPPEHLITVDGSAVK